LKCGRRPVAGAPRRRPRGPAAGVCGVPGRDVGHVS
jgi:hypothetical protein